jgi:hypothetical protein
MATATAKITAQGSVAIFTINGSIYHGLGCVKVVGYFFIAGISYCKSENNKIFKGYTLV